MVKFVITADKKDYLRALLTDTTPWEVPLIFTNQGFYRNYSEYVKPGHSPHLSFVSGLFRDSPYTIPYVYKVNKGGGGIRSLYLVHPLSQVSYSEFYKEYDGLICYYCKDSKSSIRSPFKVGNRYVVTRYSKALDKYRADHIDTLIDDVNSKFSMSYFAYSGYRRLYMFINSAEYLRLEKRFQNLVCLDVAHCFDSVYTHSIAWATKSKPFAKAHVGKLKHSFGAAFDSLIQKSNYNETNGIPIGAELSRVFAEVLLEGIDRPCVST